MTLNLGKLSSSKYKFSDLSLKSFSKKQVLGFYSKMFLIRETENLIAEGKKEGLIGGPVHLGVGQEAIAVGVSSELKSNYKVFSGHRSHAHILALGSDQRRLFSELLGKKTGLSKGMGGSMHLLDKSVGFYGSVPIVAGTVPLAVGAALASKLQKKQEVVISYFGDGASEEGVVHESFNLASQYKLPILFVVENNLFSSHLHIDERQPSDSIARFAHANFIPYKILDGNDVIAISQTSKKLISDCKNNCGPGLIEVVTYRWYGHVDWREDIDVGINRSSEDLRLWKKRDPIARLTQAIKKKYPDIQPLLDKISSDIKNKSELNWQMALKDPYPDESDLIDFVYSSPK